MAAEFSPRSITIPSSEPLAAVFLEEDGHPVVRYFADDTTDTTPTDDVTRAALAAIGSCSDLDWDTWAAELDHLRHESPPTPPIEL